MARVRIFRAECFSCPNEVRARKTQSPENSYESHLLPPEFKQSECHSVFCVIVVNITALEGTFLLPTRAENTLLLLTRAEKILLLPTRAEKTLLLPTRVENKFFRPWWEFFGGIFLFRSWISLYLPMQ